MNKIDVLGYSERGIFNSIVFYLRENPEKMQEFMKTLEIESVYSDCINYKFTFLVEQSFSDFGTSDLVLIAENHKNNSKIVIFIEGKIKTEQGNFSLEKQFEKIINCTVKFDGISSNIFVQLYYKYLLSSIISINQISTKSLNINDIFKKNNNQERQLGSNKIVKEAVEKISNVTNVFYVAILPENIPSVDFQTKFTELNNTIFENEPMPMPITNIISVYWRDIKNVFLNSIVNENFDYNNEQIY